MPQTASPPIPITRPLQLVELLVLAVLTEGPCHGYGLVQELDERADGALQLRPGNFYRVLDRLADAGLLQESEPPGDAPGSGRRGADRTRGFAITESGRRRLDSETRLRAKTLGATAASREALLDGMGSGS